MARRLHERDRRKNPQTLLSERFVAYLVQHAGVQQDQIGFQGFTKYHGNRNREVEVIENDPRPSSSHLVLRVYNTHVFRDFHVSAPPEKFADIIAAADSFYKPR